jgi:hypothetical protein
MTKKLQNEILKLLPKIYRYKKYNTDKEMLDLEVNGDEVIITYKALEPIKHRILTETEEQFYLFQGRDIKLQGTIMYNTGEIFKQNLGKFHGVKELVRDYKINKLVK